MAIFAPLTFGDFTLFDDFGGIANTRRILMRAKGTRVDSRDRAQAVFDSSGEIRRLELDTPLRSSFLTMMSTEPQSSSPESGRLRTLKRILRFLPRRSALHRYPLIGRFAPHLWSIRREQLQPAYYVGSIIAFLPLLGLQLPLALVLSLLFRANFMVMGGLQLITNPVTAAPVYYATHYVGSHVTAFFYPAPNQGEVGPDPDETEKVSRVIGEEVIDLFTTPETPPPSWPMRLRAALGALTVGGAIFGLLTGLLLDALDVFLRRSAKPRPEPRPTAEL